MPRKANNGKQTLFTLEMAESYFSAIKSDFDSLKMDVEERFVNFEQRFDQRFEDQNKILKTILSIVNNSEVERKEVKSTLWEHDRRILKLEHKTA